MERKKLNTRTIVMAAMLGAIAAVLMFVEFSVPFAPPFVKFDLSDLPVLLAGFLFGPALGSLTAVIKILLKLLIKPTSTMFVGELSNLILSITFMLVAAIFYRQHKTRKGAVIWMLIATIATSAIALLSNYFFIFPMYAKLFGMTMESIVKMVTAVNPAVHSVFTMFIYSLLPFNMFKYGVISLITFFIYKKISVILKKYMLK